MTCATPPDQRFSTLHAAAKLLLVLLVGVALAGAGLYAAGAGDQLAAVLGTAAVCYVASVVSLEPVRLASRVSPEKVPLAALVGMVLRLLLTLAGATAMVKAAGMAAPAVGLGVVFWYLLLLVAEVVLLVRYFGTMRGIRGSSSETISAAGSPSGTEVGAC